MLLEAGDLCKGKVKRGGGLWQQWLGRSANVNLMGPHTHVHAHTHTHTVSRTQLKRLFFLLSNCLVAILM